MNNGYVIFVITEDMRTGYLYSAEKGNLVVGQSPIDSLRFPTQAAAEHLAERLSVDDLITYYELQEMCDITPSSSATRGIGINL